MATYYKYEKADDISKSMIDWSGLTKTISDNLMGEKKKRDNLKQKIEVDNAKQLQELDKFEQGLDPTLNAKMLQYSQSYKQYLLENHKLMKRGLITVNDAMLIKQNASDSWANMNMATKNFNQNIKAVIDKGGNVNDFKAKFAAELFDFKDKKLFINDQGVASVANVDDKGNIDKNTLVPWTTLNNTMMQPQGRYDLKGQISSIVAGAAEWTKAPSPYLSVTDARQREVEYGIWKENKITEALAGDATQISAAADELDMQPTVDKALVESNPKKYFLAEMVNGKMEYTLDDTQKKDLRDLVGNAIEMGLGRKEVRKAPAQPSAAQIKAGGDAKKEAKTFRLIQGALQGSESDLQSLSNIYGFKDIIKLPDGDIQIVDSNNKVKTVKITDSFAEAGSTFASAISDKLDSEKLRNELLGVEGGVSSSFKTNIDTVGFTTTVAAPKKLNTRDNIDKLQESLFLNLNGNKIPKKKISDIVPSFNSEIQSIAGPIGIEVITLDDGDVQIGEILIKDGVRKPSEVLRVLEEKANKPIEGKGRLNNINIEEEKEEEKGN